MPSKFPKATLIEEVRAVYTDPNVHALSRLVVTTSGVRDPQATFTCFMLDLEARIYGNRQVVERTNRDHALWQYKRALIERCTGQDLLLPTAPSADSVRKWRYRFLPVQPVDPDNDALPEVLQTFLETYTQLAVHRAMELGNFAPNQERDFTRTKKRHTVVADGTYISPYSKAQKWIDHEGRTHLLHSRAASEHTARLQTYDTGTKAGRAFMGVNQTAAVALTRYGRVHLGLTRAFRGEAAALVRVMDQILTHTADGIHTLVYDKAAAGWPEHYLLARHGVLVRMPSIRHSSTDPATAQTTLDAQEAIRAATPLTLTRKGKKRKRLTVPTVHVAALAAHELNVKYKVDDLIARHRAGEAIGAGLPLGTSQYVNSKKNVEQVQSKHLKYPTYTHPIGDDQECAHHLYVDHGALWDTTATPTGLVKTQRLSCAQSTAVHTDGQYELHTRHTLTCHHTGEVLEIPTTVWTPNPTHGKSEAKKKVDDDIRAATMVRPLAECDPTWRKNYSIRNNIESWFSQLKNRLLPDAQAASLDLNHQFLDTLYFGLIINALALRQYRLQNPTTT